MSIQKVFFVFSFMFLVFAIAFFVDSNNKTGTITGLVTSAYKDIDFSKVSYSEIDIPINNSVTFTLDGKDLHDLRIIDPQGSVVRAYLDTKSVYFSIGKKQEFDFNLDQKPDLSILVDNYFSNQVHLVMSKEFCTQDWYCTEYTPCTGGLQTRECVDKNNCGTKTNIPPLQQPCEASCSDGLKNQGEEDIDCGGPCNKCEDKNRLIYIWAVVPIISAILLMLVVYLVIKKKERPYRALEKPLIKEISPKEDKYVKEAVKESGIIPKSKEELEALAQLEDYINEALTRRVSISEIKENLISVGWEEKIVELTLTKMVKKRR